MRHRAEYVAARKLTTAYPSGWFVMRPASAGPANLVACAVLKRAVSDIDGEYGASQKDFCDAMYWVFWPGQDHDVRLFTFSGVCSTLGVPPDRVRAWIRKRLKHEHQQEALDAIQREWKREPLRLTCRTLLSS